MMCLNECDSIRTVNTNFRIIIILFFFLFFIFYFILFFFICLFVKYNDIDRQIWNNNSKNKI